MPVVRISDATFSDLKTIATWLGTDTPSKTIDRITEEMMDKLDLEREEQVTSSKQQHREEGHQYDKAPGLSFTRVLSASVNGQPIQKPNWAGVLVEMISAVQQTGLTAEQLVNELQIPSRVEKYESEGFRFHQKLGVSVQGQSAQDAWRETIRLAKKWDIPVQVKFQWRDNPKAQHPGRIGVLS